MKPPDDNYGDDSIEIHPMHLLPFDSLPNKKQVWPGRPGSREEGLGRLVLLTPEVVAAAASACIRTGRRVSLGWELTKLEIANFGRSPCDHKIVPLLDGVAFDDIYTFNPQQSSQWDGLRHFSQPQPRLQPQPSPSASSSDSPSTSTRDNETVSSSEREGSRAKERLFYGGVTKSEITDPLNHRIGIHHWAKEGICGRGVLLDYVSYAQRRGIAYSTFSDHSIPLSVLLEIARDQNNLEFRRGDILFVRVGVTREWDTAMTRRDKVAYAESKNPQHAGVQGTEEMVRWIWDSGFAAVASDAVSFEVYPPKSTYARHHRDGSDGSRGEARSGGGGGGSGGVDRGDCREEAEEVPGIFMHEYLLAGWGLPIGELFDLEGLSRLCEEHGRWEFFVASAPLNMPGGVSSPPNCIAIF
ncbi:hypothetical protein RBB50_011670 [Rhinocladiella similis]